MMTHVYVYIFYVSVGRWKDAEPKQNIARLKFISDLNTWSCIAEMCGIFCTISSNQQEAEAFVSISIKQHSYE